MTSLICEIQNEVMQMKLLTKQKQTHRLREWIYGYWGRRMGEEFKQQLLGLMAEHYTLNPEW